MGFDPSKVVLGGFYTDGAESTLKTDVYSNGEMQAEVWVSINYLDSIEGIESDVNEYVYNNTTVYELVGSDKEEVTWEKSAESNEYLHDINRSSLDSPRTRNDYRIPIYFKVPKGKGGLYKWIAELDGKETSSSTPVEVNATTIAVQPNDVEIIHIETKNQSVLRSIRYTHAQLPGNHMLKKWQYEGVALKATKHWKGNCWIVMIHNGYSCAALPYKEDEIQVALKDTNYYTNYEIKNPENSVGLSGDEAMLKTSKYDWGDANGVSQERAWNEGGLAMVGIIPCRKDNTFHLHSGNKGDLNFRYNPVAQDNFGNWLRFIMDWDVTKQHFKDWKVDHVEFANI